MLSVIKRLTNKAPTEYLLVVWLD